MENFIQTNSTFRIALLYFLLKHKINMFSYAILSLSLSPVSPVFHVAR